MQIAKMFATLGFNVDVSGLNKFKTELNSAKPSATQFALSVRILTQNLNKLVDQLNRVNKNLKFEGGGKGQKVETGYNNIAKATNTLSAALDNIANKQPKTTKALGKIHSALKFGTPLWQAYGNAAAHANSQINQTISRISRLRQAASGRISVNTDLGRGGFGGGFGGGGGGGGASWMGQGGQQFFRSMLPTALISTGMAAAGYGLQEVVQQGRELTRMESRLLFSSQGKGDALQGDYRDSLDFVSGISSRLGINMSELGSAFAQVNQTSSEVLTKDQRKEMFTNLSEFVMTTGADKTDQKLILKAINQMFSLGRIMAEEMNQLTERGIPRKLIYDVAKDVYGYKTTADVIKAQEAGKLKGEDILPELFRRFATMAHETGAFEKMLGSSGTQQNIASVEFSKTAKAIMDAGLDKALALMFSWLTKLLIFLREDLPIYLRPFLDVISEVINFLKILKGMFDMGWESSSQELKNVFYALIIALALTKLGFTALIAQMILYVRGAFLARASTILLAKSLLLLLARFALVLGGLFLIYQAMKAFNAKVAGEMTWMDVWSQKFHIGLLMAELYFTRLKLYYTNFKMWMKNKITDDPALTYMFKSNQEFLQREFSLTPPPESGGAASTGAGGMLSFASGYRQPSAPSYSANSGFNNFDGRLAIDILNNGKRVDSKTIESGNSSYLSLPT